MKPLSALFKLLLALKLICFRLTLTCQKFVAVCLIQTAALLAEPMLIYNLPTASIWGRGPHMPAPSYKSIFAEISAESRTKNVIGLWDNRRGGKGSERARRA